MSYDCWNCCDAGCPDCAEFGPKEGIVERINEYAPDSVWTAPEPWPSEAWLDLTDADLEQLVCDGLDELARRGKRRERLEGLFTL